jgi:hypothetical protein
VPFERWDEKQLQLWFDLLNQPTLTSKGQRMLVHEDCFFLQKHTYPQDPMTGLTTIDWRCRSYPDCSAHIRTERSWNDEDDMLQDSEPIVVTPHTVQVGPSCELYCRQKADNAVLHHKACSLIKDLCLTKHLPFRDTVDMVRNVMTMVKPTCAHGFTTGALDQTIRKIKRQNAPQLPGPNAIGQLHLPAAYQYTIRGEKFLLYNCRQQFLNRQEVGRLTVFGTLTFLNYLLRLSTVYIDGTFRPTTGSGPSNSYNPSTGSSGRPGFRSCTPS